MNILKAWLSKSGVRPSTFARQINRPASTITRVLAGKRRVGTKLALDIQGATHGEVKAIDLLAENLRNEPEAA